MQGETSLSVLLYKPIPRRGVGFLLPFPSVFFHHIKCFYFKLYHFFSQKTLPKTLLVNGIFYLNILQ